MKEVIQVSIREDMSMCLLISKDSASCQVVGDSLRIVLPQKVAADLAYKLNNVISILKRM